MLGIHDNQTPVNAVREGLKGSLTVFSLHDVLPQVGQILEPDDPQMGRPINRMDGRFECLFRPGMVVVSSQVVVRELN